MRWMKERQRTRGSATMFSVLLGGGLAVVHGVLARFIFDRGSAGAVFAVMSLAFFLVVPFVLGVLTVRGVDAPSRTFRIFAPWVPMLTVVLATVAVGWEGMICVVMALPILLLMASAGGMMTYSEQLRSRGSLPLLLALPYLVAPLEARLPEPERFGETVTSIDIAAPPSVVWPLIASVDSIRPEEQRPALYLALGFPKPISATLSRPGVGGVRFARFEHGLTFTETVTEWVPERRLAFTIHPNTTLVPPTALDSHVMVGGPHFDVMSGTYELHPLAGGRSTRLVLRSTHRLTTRVNPYAEWWVERVMASIQNHISEVHKARAERGAPTASSARAAVDTGRCDVGIAARATEGVIDEALIGKLLGAGSAACSEDVEFMEVFNEAVFYCLERQPDAFIRQFAVAPDQAFIVGALESPVNDVIDVSGILATVKRSSLAGTPAQRRIVAALETAIGKG